MKGWHNESYRHSLASRGIPTRYSNSRPETIHSIDDYASPIGMNRFNHVIDLLTPEMWKDLMSFYNIKDLEMKIREYQCDLVNREKDLEFYYCNEDGTLCCEHSQNIMGLVLNHWKIPYKVVFGFNDKGWSHVWIRVDGVDYDPSGQGMGPGYGIIVERWDPDVGGYFLGVSGEPIDPDYLLRQIKSGMEGEGISDHDRDQIGWFGVNVPWEEMS